MIVRKLDSTLTVMKRCAILPASRNPFRILQSLDLIEKGFEDYFDLL